MNCHDSNFVVSGGTRGCHDRRRWRQSCYHDGYRLSASKHGRVSLLTARNIAVNHDDVIKWKHFPRYWLFVRGIHRSPVNSPHKGQWRGAFTFSLICAWINRWVNCRETGDLRRYRAHYDVIVMLGQLWYPFMSKRFALRYVTRDNHWPAGVLIRQKYF